MPTVKAVATDPRNISATALALVGVADWLLGSYVFHGATPAPVAAAVYVILPAVVAYITSHIALNTFPPALLNKLRADLVDAQKNGRVTILQPNAQGVQRQETEDRSTNSQKSAGAGVNTNPPQDAA